MGTMTIDGLAKIVERMRHQTAVRKGVGRVRITIHMGTCGIAAGARTILTTILDEIDHRDLYDVIVLNAGCAGMCSREPMMTVEFADGPAPVRYGLLTPEKVKKIIDSHVVRGEVVREYALAGGNETTRPAMN